MRQNKVLLSILIIVVLFLSRKTAYFYAYVIFGVEGWKAMDLGTKTMIVQASGVVIPLLLVAAFNRFNIRALLDDLGLGKGFPTGLMYAALFVSPMFIGNPFAAPLRSPILLQDAWEMAIWPGFNEELIFRGILVGQLFKRAGWGFIPASLLSSLYFAMGHLYQAEDVMGAIQIFAITAAGGIGFALVFIEWSWNLWLPMFMHMLMNLHTVVFDTGNTAALNATGNVFRILTIVLAVVFTVRLVKRQGSALKGKLWINRGAADSPTDETKGVVKG